MQEASSCNWQARPESAYRVSLSEPSVDRLIVRLSSLGDVVLTGAVTTAWGGGTAILTLPRFAEVASRLHGISRVYAPGDVLPSVPIIDLQCSLASRRLTLGHRVTRVHRQDVRRRLRVALKMAPADRVIDRYARAAGVEPAPTPWFPLAERGHTLLLAPGAAHATKRWPYWLSLARAWPGPVRAIGGPDDAELVSRIGGVCEVGFARTFDAMNGACAIVAGDTGLLHLGAALGVPVVGIFGPTTSIDGFWCHEGQVVELPLACRPCSRFGGLVCPVGDHACMRQITVDSVVAAVERAISRAAGPR